MDAGVRILGHMVTRNEARRHLRAALASMRTVCSDIAVFDDASDDDTVGVLLGEGVHVDVREDNEPSFLQHEGQFRDLAWQWMADVLKPEPGDWILSLDADEVLVSDRTDLAWVHPMLAEQPADVSALDVQIHELWTFTPPRERVDGWWGKITGTRLYRWAPGRRIADKPLACGSVPAGPGRVEWCDALRIAHLGYIRREDRVAKHRRYTGRAGHSSAHVRSILTEPCLADLDGRLHI